MKTTLHPTKQPFGSKKTLNAIILAGLLFTIGCTERIDIDVDSSSSRIVVEGYLTTDTLAHRLRLTRSGNYFQNQPAQAVIGASVWLTSNTGDSIPYLETDTLPGLYTTLPTVFGEIGKTYTLHIELGSEILGESSFVSQPETINPINPVDSIGFQYQPDWGVSGYWEIKVWAQEPPSKDFYAFKAILNQTLMSDSLDEIFISDDMFYNGNYTNGVTSQYFDQAKEEEVIEVGDTVTFELNSISETYYNFIREIQEEIFGHNPLFSGPPANVKSNISGQALGFFAAYSISRKTKIVTQEDFDRKK